MNYTFNISAASHDAVRAVSQWETLDYLRDTCTQVVLVYKDTYLFLLILLLISEVSSGLALRFPSLRLMTRGKTYKLSDHPKLRWAEIVVDKIDTNLFAVVGNIARKAAFIRVLQLTLNALLIARF